MADPLYRQIADDLRQKIENGELAPGSQLPTELELRERYGNASRNTVRDAIKWLTGRGLVTTQPGRGTFVFEEIVPLIVPLSPPDESGLGDTEGDAFNNAVKQQGGQAYVSPPRVEVQNARPDVARELQIDEGSTVVSRHQQRFVDGNPSSLQTSFYRMHFVERGAVELLQAVDIDRGVTKYLEETLQVKQTGYRDRLTVRQPTVTETRFFKLSDTGTVLAVVTHRTAYARDAEPIRYTVTVYASDRNDFVNDFGEVPSFRDFVRDLSDQKRMPTGA
jgi:GntR family transcriptional regulator